MDDIGHFAFIELVTYHYSTSASLTRSAVIERRYFFYILFSLGDLHELIDSEMFIEMRWRFRYSQQISVLNFKAKATVYKFLSCHLYLVDLKRRDFNFLRKIIKARLRVHKGLEQSFLLGGVLVDDVEVIFLSKRTKDKPLIELTMNVKFSEVALNYLSTPLFSYILKV